jgi:hypothetical protein
MKTIKVTDKYRVAVIPNNYQLEEYIQGGDLVRNVGTGEMQEQKQGWRKLDVYYANLNAMVRYIARLEADENASDLNEWLDSFTDVVTAYYGD